MFLTSRKRKVYGGGGITPDIFVPVDTSWRSEFYSSLIRSGTMNTFCIDFVNDRRDSLMKAYADVDDFDRRFAISEQILELFYTFATEREMPMDDEEGMARSEPMLKLQLKALIARNMFTNSAYHQIINPIDPIFRKALETINSRKVKKTGVRT